jgi:hypothetical protein
MVQNATLYAQGVYVTRGEKGTVYSDKPQPGAKEVALPPLNIVTPPKEVRAAKPAATVAAPAAAPAPGSDNRDLDAAVLPYRSFSVISPENNGSVVANTAVFEVRVAVDPPLQLQIGHAFVVSINGRPVGQRFTASEFMIPPEFWGDTLPPPNQQLQLDASIVDGVDQILKQAAPIRFYMRYATIQNRPRPPHVPPVSPAPAPPKAPLAKPRHALEPSTESAAKRSNQ